MIGQDEPRDLAALVVPQAGWLERAEDPWQPYRLRDPAGALVGPVAAFLRDLQASGRPETTLRTYAIALLRWFRFLWAAGVSWDQATRAEARDFSRWIQIAAKPGRTGGPGGPGQGRAGVPARAALTRTGVPNPVTGKARPGRGCAPATVTHSESVLRGFYDFHCEAGTGPIVNPFPLARGRRGRAHAPQPDGALPRRTFRALPAPAGPQGAAPHPGGEVQSAVRRLGLAPRPRAGGVLRVYWGAGPGQQLITVIRKGTRHLQQLPASPDAFVWLRLYQAQLHGLVPVGPDDPLWWTLRRPFRQLTYHAAYRMFHRASASLVANWSLHDLRHLAACRMTREPGLPPADVQWVLGHAQLATTQLYLAAPAGEVIATVLAHHARMAAGNKQSPGAEPPPGLRYRPESLEVLFGRPGHDHP